MDLSAFFDEDLLRVPSSILERLRGLDGRRIFVSGGTGFYGANLLACLSQLRFRGINVQVSSLSRNPQRFLRENPWARDLSWVQWESGDVSRPWPGIGDFDFLIHAATECTVSAHSDRLRIFDTVVSGTREALEFSQKHGVERILLCGSGAQYGTIPPDLESGIRESSCFACDPCDPSSAFGEAKRAGETLAAIVSERSGIDVVVTRGFAFVGPALKLDEHYAIGNFLQSALDGRDITLHSDGSAVRSYLYSLDLAVWLLMLVLHGRSMEVYNVGSDHGVSMLDVAGRVRERVNTRSRVCVQGLESVQRRAFYLPDIGKARQLGLDVWTDLDTAIERTALWHQLKSNRDRRSLHRLEGG